jgi:hypothetical protein
MVRFLGLAAVIAPLLLGTPIDFTGHGEISGADGFFDLTGAGFHWHISTDSTTFMGSLCALGTACDLGLFFTADSLSGETSVYGHWDGLDWGSAFPANVMSDSNTYETWHFRNGVQPGTSVNVPFAISGSIVGPRLGLIFAGAGTQRVTVIDIEQGNAAVFFGSFDFSGKIASDSDSAPEPGTLALMLTAAAALAALRRARAR